MAKEVINIHCTIDIQFLHSMRCILSSTMLSPFSFWEGWVNSFWTDNIFGHLRFCSMWYHEIVVPNNIMLLSIVWSCVDLSLLISLWRYSSAFSVVTLSLPVVKRFLNYVYFFRVQYVKCRLWFWPDCIGCLIINGQSGIFDQGRISQMIHEVIIELSKPIFLF